MTSLLKTNERRQSWIKSFYYTFNLLAGQNTWKMIDQRKLPYELETFHLNPINRSIYF